MSTSTAEQPELVRGLNLLDAIMIVIGSMIGSGIFLTSAESARLVGAPGWLLAAWSLAGVLTITGALCCAELAGMWPRAGGQYFFLRKAYSPAVGFLFGWSLFLIIQTGTIAAVAVAFSNFAGVLAPWISADNYLIRPRLVGRYAFGLSTQQLLAIVTILGLTVSNMRGLKTGKLIQNTFTFTKTAALAGLIVVGFLFGVNSHSAAFTSSWWNPWLNNWSPQVAQNDLTIFGALALVMLLGRSMIGPLFAQSAWNNVTFTGAEIRNPGRNLPRSLLIGCGAVVLLYLLANLSYVVTLPLPGIQNASQGRVATDMMRTIFGQSGTVIMAVAIMISTFGCNNGLILAGARVYYAMARDGLFFSRAGELNSKHFPAMALAAQGVWASLLTIPRTATINPLSGTVTYQNVYTQLLEYIVSADLIFYMLMIGAVIVTRFRSPGMDRPYRTPGYPLVPIIYLGIALLLILDLGYLAPLTSGLGFVIVLSGLPVYFIWKLVGRSNGVISTNRGI